jgi:hypothetical protein
MTDSIEKQALDEMGKLVTEMNDSFPPRDRMEILRMLWKAFELGQQREKRNYFVPDLPAIPVIEKRCATLSDPRD